MKKIGIVTIGYSGDHSYNYGNDLQNYALNEFLSLHNCYSERINYKSFIPDYTIQNLQNGKNKRFENFGQFIDDGLRVLKRKLFRKTIEEKRLHRDNGFRTFINENLYYSKEVYDSNSDLSQINDDFDYFVVGSDQVWNPLYEGSNEFYYLTFAQEEKRVAYAPSIGLDSIPEIVPLNVVNNIKNWLNGFKKISIRETGGQELLKTQFNLDSELVCDPVFLLSKDEWLKIATNAEASGDYFAVYILGKKTPKIKKDIKLIAKKYGIKSVDIFSPDDKNSVFCTPQEFVDVINRSKFVVTNSFHGAAFSQIFSKPLVIVERDNPQNNNSLKMSGRIDSLLDLVGLKNRSAKDILSGKSELDVIADLNNSKFGKLIEVSKKYLLDSLRIS